MKRLILYDYFRSSAAYRVRIALAMKGVEYERVETSLLAGDQKSDAYRAINPQGLVPVLVVDDVVLTQSLAIIDWIDRTWPEPALIPADDLARARALSQAMIVGADIHPLNNLRVLKYLTRDLGLNDHVKDRWYANWIHTGFSALEAQAGDGDFLGGATPGIADIFLVPQVYNARRFEIDLDLYPRIVAIDAACAELPAFAAAHPDRVKGQ